MFKMLLKIILLSLLVYVKAYNKCLERISFYEAMGCEPIINGVDSCPQRYNCQDVSPRRETQCFFRGKYYNPSERISTEFTKTSCMFECICANSGHVQCAAFSCPEHLVHLPMGCYHSYGRKCCPEKVFCANNITVRCSLEEEIGSDRITYEEGSIFYSKNDPCVECQCQEGYRGVIEEPFCRRKQCRAEKLHYDNFLKNCAPIYGRAQCCVMKFKCPSPEDHIVRHFKESQFSGPTCRYGNEILNIGDKVENESMKITCECVIPPLVTCISNKDHEYY